MPRTQQQQAGSRGRRSSCLLPLLLLAGALSSHAAIHIPSNCEYTRTNRRTLAPWPVGVGRWPSSRTGGFKDAFVVLMAAPIIKGCN